MNPWIGALLLSCVVVLMQAQQLKVITTEVDNTVALVHFLASLPIPLLKGLAGKPETGVADLSNPSKARKSLESALDAARANDSLRQEVKRIVNNGSLPLWASSVLKQESITAAGLPKVTPDRSPFPSPEGDPITKWPLSGLADPATSASQTTSTSTNVAVSYQIDGPVTLAYLGVKIKSLKIYGTPDDLIDYLLRSGLIDCNCALLPPAKCDLSLLNLRGKSIPIDAQDAPRMDHRIKLLLAPDDFVSIYKSLPQSKIQLSKAIEEGFEKGRKFRHENETQPDEESGVKGAKPTLHEEGSACEKEFKVCMSADFASMVLGCEGKGEIEINTNGQLSLSIPVGSKSLKDLRRTGSPTKP